MTLVRFNPRRMMNAHEGWNRMFNELLGYEGDEEVMTQVWAPRADIVEDEKNYRVVMDLPGVKKEDVNLSLENNVLTISGERKMEREEKKGDHYHLTERAYGRFSRSFTLRNTIDQEKIEAKFEDGELIIELPKVEKALPRKIEIKTN